MEIKGYDVIKKHLRSFAQETLVYNLLITRKGFTLKEKQMSQAPQWFQAFEKKIDVKFEKIDQRLAGLEKQFDKLYENNPTLIK